jgi:predicted nucleic acid-binding protein
LVVSNTTPLVYLAALGDFGLLPDLFGKVIVPRAVFQEIVVGGAKLPVAVAVHLAVESWLFVMDVSNIAEADGLRQGGLHAGESEAIALATELAPDALLMDDAAGVRAAVAGGANVIRTPGIYRVAKERHLISSVRPKLDELRRVGFWLRDEHYQMILQSLGE